MICSHNFEHTIQRDRTQTREAQKFSLGYVGTRITLSSSAQEILSSQLAQENHTGNRRWTGGAILEGDNSKYQAQKNQLEAGLLFKVITY